MFLITWLVSNLLLLSLVLRLTQRQVYLELPFLFTCLSFRLLQAMAIAAALNRVAFLSQAYLFTWFITESIAVVLVALASAESYLWLTLRIFRPGRVGAVALTVAGLLGLAAMWSMKADSAEDLSRSLAAQYLFKQAVMGFLAVSLGALLSFYRRFPLQVPRQAWPHALTQLTYLATHSLGYGAMAMGGYGSTERVNDVLAVIWAGCLLAWLWIFRHGVTWPDPPPDAGGEGLKRADEQAARLERLL